MLCVRLVEWGHVMRENASEKGFCVVQFTLSSSVRSSWQRVAEADRTGSGSLEAKKPNSWKG